jgi:hypothetical protein
MQDWLEDLPVKAWMAVGSRPLSRELDMHEPDNPKEGHDD